jgi:Kef-type K+ transport system membrane component KefB
MLAQKLGQPQVVGEMIAGIFLGPSVIGALFPAVQGWIFPESTMGILYAVSQIGLVFYMFTIGLEFDVSLVRNRFRSAAAVSLAGILAPLALGAALAWATYGDTVLFPGTVDLVSAMLFLGAAMSVTAFPVLSRILQERGLIGTVVGTLALAAGSIDDAIAWCLLAIMLAMFGGMSDVPLVAIGGGVGYVAIVLLVGRPVLHKLGGRAEQAGKLSGTVLAAAIVLLMLGAWFTDTIGIHAVFGAFILGVAMPRGVVARDLRQVIEPITLNVLLPLFFVYSGLNTKIGLVDTPFLWLMTLIIILNAILGKFVACWLAARVVGESNQVSLGLGMLMNARGLMELILLNIGLTRGVITSTLFTMMVIMALVTTFMALPLFDLVYSRYARGSGPTDHIDREGQSARRLF